MPEETIFNTEICPRISVLWKNPTNFNIGHPEPPTGHFFSAFMNGKSELEFQRNQKIDFQPLIKICCWKKVTDVAILIKPYRNLF